MSSNTSNPILSFTRPRSATPPHGNGPHPCIRPKGNEQAFGAKCWFFGARIVGSLSNSPPSIPGELENDKGYYDVRRLLRSRPRFFRERRSLGAIFPAH